FPVAGMPCRWRRIIGSGSDSASANDNFFTDRSLCTQFDVLLSKTQVKGHKKTGQRPVFISQDY
ncbi:hypothetical protein, partial [Pantoea anthophila]|uniref:hypothetical protein n=1 Tax=Pantoea anthophila TaxID=470931 RepID=UPI001F28E5F7